MPTVTMIAGPNGSGKTTLIEHLLKAGLNLGEYFNADDIARGMTGDAVEIAQNAQQVVRDRRQAALAAQRDHAFETVMSHPSHIEHLLRARSADFETRLLYVCTDNPNWNVGRVANRVLHGGHFVPPDRVVARYHRSLANLPAAIDASDHVLVFDNSHPGRALRCLAEIRSGMLHHRQLPRTGTGIAIDLPRWWNRILYRIKPADTYRDGPLS